MKTALRSGLALATWMVGVGPARAVPLLVPRDEVPRPGQVSLDVQAQVVPMTLVVRQGQTFQTNPPGAGTTQVPIFPEVRLGLPADTDLELDVPAVGWKRVDGTAGGLAPGDVALGLGRRVSWTRQGGARARVLVALPTGQASDSAAAQVAPGEGVASVGFDASVRQVLLEDADFGDRLVGWGGFGYRYALRQALPQPDGSVAAFWKGQRAQIALSAEYFVFHRLSVLAEGQVAWVGMQETNRLADPTSGSWLVMLAPGVSYRITPRMTATLGALLPVFRAGNGPSYQGALAAGYSADF